MRTLFVLTTFLCAIANMAEASESIDLNLTLGSVDCVRTVYNGKSTVESGETRAGKPIKLTIILDRHNKDDNLTGNARVEINVQGKIVTAAVMMAKFQENGNHPFYRVSASFDYSEVSAAQDFVAQNGIPRFYIGGPIVWTRENRGFYPTIEFESQWLTASTRRFIAVLSSRTSAPEGLEIPASTDALASSDARGALQQSGRSTGVFVERCSVPARLSLEDTKRIIWPAKL